MRKWKLSKCKEMAEFLDSKEHKILVGLQILDKYGTLTKQQKEFLKELKEKAGKLGREAEEELEDVKNER